MKRKLASLIILGAVVPALAQQAPSRIPAANDVAPVISKLTIPPDTVTDLRLKPFYAATIRMPEAVSSVVVGAPILFLAEHNEHEPDLVVVKPITADPSASNLLIATKSGQVVSLRLLSDGSVPNAIGTRGYGLGAWIQALRWATQPKMVKAANTTRSATVCQTTGR